MDTQEEIARLQRESDKHKDALKEELSDWTERSKSIAIKILIAGGGLALAYIIARKIFDKGKDIKDDQDGDTKSTFTEIRNFILTELAAFLLSIAKEKLLEYLKEHKEEINVDTADTEP